MTFANYIKKMRIKRKWTQFAVADKSCLTNTMFTASHLSDIERGKAIPSLKVIMSLSEIFNVSKIKLVKKCFKQMEG